MPACGSEGACLEGLWSSKTGGASPQCLGSPISTRPHRPHQHHHHHHQYLHHQVSNGLIPVSKLKKPSYLRRLISSFLRVFHKILTYSILAPAVWLSAWLCLFWLFLQIPLSMLKFVLKFLRYTRLDSSRKKRCVLISGGSTVQAIHLARSLSKAGARVVVCELEGLFGLARFSTACARYYTLPRPGSPGGGTGGVAGTGWRSGAGAAEYVSALKDIVRRERVSSYIPVSASSTAYYDGLARPHLEMMGCECLVPGAAEVALLDDPLELVRRARLLGLPTPQHELLNSLEDATRLYENGSLRGRHYALLAGPAGMRERCPDLRLPLTLAEFTRSQLQLQQQQQQQQRNGRDGRSWLVIRDPGGAHYVTCTTVRDSKLAANVTCRVDELRSQLVLEDRPEVTRWLERFFSRGFAGQAKINGHVSFRFAAAEEKPEEVMAIGCRVGVGLPYLCYTSHQVRLLWRTCRHKSRVEFSNGVGVGQQVTENGSIGKALDKREALFLYWDPLPYCVYCYLQLPFRRVVGALGAQQTQHKPPLAVVQ